MPPRRARPARPSSRPPWTHEGTRSRPSLPRPGAPTPRTGQGDDSAIRRARGDPRARILLVVAIGALLGALSAPWLPGLTGRLRRTVAQELDALRPDVPWPTGAPEAHGIAPGCLEGLRRELAERRTQSLLVARDGRLVYEWYRSGSSADDLHYTAALTKALVASPALAFALEEGRLELDDPVSRYVPAWRGDPRKSRVTIAQLASHSSGLDDVRFVDDQEGWRARYFRHPEERFALALEHGELVAPSNGRYHYSGMGYYVLSYAITASLQRSGYPDLRTLLRERLMAPLGVPDRAWRMSYGETYRFDGMTQVAIGSGGYYNARAVARVGQLVADGGRWEGRTLLPPEQLKRLTRPWARTAPNAPAPRPGLGWWLNTDGFWPSLPRDAVVGAGMGHQLLLVLPSEGLVAVRMGAELEPPQVWGPPFWQAAGEHFFEPLMACVEERRGGASERRAAAR